LKSDDFVVNRTRVGYEVKFYHKNHIVEIFLLLIISLALSYGIYQLLTKLLLALLSFLLGFLILLQYYFFVIGDNCIEISLINKKITIVNQNLIGRYFVKPKCFYPDKLNEISHCSIPFSNRVNESRILISRSGISNVIINGNSSSEFDQLKLVFSLLMKNTDWKSEKYIE